MLVLWAIGWLAVPPLVKAQLERRGSDALGRALTVGAVEFRPWTLELTLRDVAVAARDAGAPPQLAVARVHVDADLRSLVRLAPVVEAVEVDAPRVRLARLADARYDIDDLIERFRPRAGAPAAEPARFALYNLQLRDGELLFDDRPAARVHRLEALQVGLPFLSNLPSHVDVKVEPRLAWRLNGAAFDSGGDARPFAAARDASLGLRVADVDLAPYLPYLPDVLPLRVRAGRADFEVAVRFAQPPGAAATLAISGAAALRDAAFTHRDGAPLASWKRLDIALADVQPLARRVLLGPVRLHGAVLSVARAADGRIDLASLAGGRGAAAPAPAASAAATRAATPPASAWAAGIESVELVDARVEWRDASTRPAAALQLEALSLRTARVAWPVAQPVAFELDSQLRGAGGPPARVSLRGEATDRSARADAQLADVRVEAFAPYLAQALAPTAEGRLAGEATLEWSHDPAALRATVRRLSLNDVRLTDRPRAAREALVVWRALEVSDAIVDLAARRIEIGRLSWSQPSARVERARDGTWAAQRWLVPPRDAQESGPDVAERHAAGRASPAAPADGDWRLAIADLTVDGGGLRFVDESVDPPVRADLEGLRLGVKAFAWSADGTRTAPARVELAADVARGVARGERRDRGEPRGRLEWRGQASIAPLSVRGGLRLERIPVHLFARYATESLNVDLLRAEAGFRGDVAFARSARGAEASVAGDALLSGVRVQSRPAAGSLAMPEELLNWQTLTVRGLKAALASGAKPRVDVAEAELRDFFSRLVITEQGRFNLRDVAPVAEAPAAAAPAAVADAGLPLDLTVTATKLVNGRIDFSDRFIRPNYSADLSELNGTLGRFSSASPRDMAAIELRGKAAGTATLEVRGALNPTADPLALDIQARATDLELAPLSPYAGKYAGYAIERGKLSMDVAYRIDPDGRLDAQNQVVLNQLTFGEKIESPDATKLPVLLAVALLKDRNGVIDINLPVSGSISDPQFSVFGVVLKVIGNLLVKALTAPFSLLAGGGGPDLSHVEFAPGSPQPAESARAVIDKVAQALVDRPALTMTVTGAADPASERDAIQRRTLEARLVAERRRELARAGTAPADDAPVDLAAEDRQRLVREVYRQTDLPGKPRNALGFARDIPVSEMEALLRAATVVSTESARELALRRGVAVRDALIAKGLPSERLFLAAPKLRGAAEDDAAWTPRVQLALSVR